MVLKTVLHNKTTETIILRESQGGVLRMMEPPLQAGGEKTVRTNESATYKEYWCAVQTNNEKVVLTSDDCIEWKELDIIRPDASSNSITWKGTVPRQSRNQAQVAAGASDTAGSSSGQSASSAAGQPAKAGSLVPAHGFFSSIKQWFRKSSLGTSSPSDTPAASAREGPTNGPSDQGPNPPEGSQET